jgi:hypothetical protein
MTIQITTTENKECWPSGVESDGQRIMLTSSKGGDPAEWPEDLRVREFPQTSAEEPVT